MVKVMVLVVEGKKHTTASWRSLIGVPTVYLVNVPSEFLDIVLDVEGLG
jgi:hypothetical protein